MGKWDRRGQEAEGGGGWGGGGAGRLLSLHYSVQFESRSLLHVLEFSA